MKNLRVKNKRFISTFEIFVMITAVFAFAYLISSPEIISAVAETPKECCPEANNGAICQDMNTIDADMCKTSLLPTSCDNYDSCKKGCCYDSQQGLCSPNSPKDKCKNNGGNWSDDATCDSQSQCSLGCCVLGTQAPMVTERECAKLSGEYGFTKSFKSLDSSGGCFSYANSDEEGACVMTSGIAPFECKFTTKGKCQSSNGNFTKNSLCTNIELNTICVPKIGGKFKTTCIEGKDGVYFVDSCGNTANIYDSSRAEDTEYWKTVISASQSCASTPNSASCGNCDILTGSTCKQYGSGRDAKPSIGENICRDLNCNAYNKKNGESWCVSEYDSSKFGVAPVGSRWFKAICMNGEVTVEACADFNQEICLQQSSGSFSEAQCVMNDWRTCLSVNDQGEDTTYEDVKEECDKNPQCVMFNEIEGETTVSDAYNEGDVTGFPGFRILDWQGSSIENIEQASYNDVGKEYNKVIPHCVPKYTPGLQFWTSENSSSSTASGTSSTANYGGSTAETNAICSLGNFICIGGEKKSSLFGSMEEDENIICITDPETSGVKEQVPVYIDTLNERCRMLGPCGAYVNIVGELGSNAEDMNKNNTKLIQRMKIDSSGDTSKGRGSTDKYSEGYLESLIEKPGAYLALEEFSGTNKGGSVPAVDALKIKDVLSKLQGEAEYDPGIFAQYAPSAIISLTTMVGAMLIKSFVEKVIETTTTQITFTLAVQELTFVTENTVTTVFNPTQGFSMANLEAGLWGVAAAIVTNIILNQWDPLGGGMSPGEKQAVYSAISATAGGITTALIIGMTLGPAAVLVGIGIAISIIVSIFTYKTEHQYYVMSYTCAPWEPPLVGKCDACNTNPIIPCSDYRCRSLGADCQYFNNLGEPGTCAKITDTSSATISPWPEALTSPYQYSDVQETKFTIDNIEAYTGIEFGVITNKYAACKIDTKHTSSFDEMSYDLLSETGRKGYNHKIALSPFVSSASSTTEDTNTGTAGTGEIVNEESAESTDTTSTAITTSENSVATLSLKTGQNLYYIRCKNFAGQFNRAEFIAKINVKEGPDATPPTITRFIPETNSYVGYGLNTTTAQFYVTEPSECRYSKDYNLAYNDMIENTTCINTAVSGEWPCYTILNLTGEENNYYFKCKDSAGNKNENSKEYSLKSCQTGLNITSKSPSGEIKIGTQTANVEIKLSTKGCIDGGKAICQFDLNGLSDFANTDSTEHSQIFTVLPADEYNIPVTCRDIAGNTASDIISFNVTIDDSEPIVIFASKSGGTLKIITNEPAECVYMVGNATQEQTCYFEFNEATMMNDQSLIHTTNYNMDNTYYIKCRDAFNVTNSDCGMIVKP